MAGEQVVVPAAPPIEDPPEGTGEGTQGTEEDRVKAIAAAEHAKGTRAGRTAMLRQLGFQTVEEANTFLETARAGQQSQGELEQKVQALSSELAQLRTENRNLQANDLITSGLVQAGVKSDRMARAAALVRNDLANGIEAPTADAVADVVNALKTDMPELFGTASPPPPVIPAPGGLQGGTQPPGTNGQKQPGSEGLAEFERRFGKAKRP